MSISRRKFLLGGVAAAAAAPFSRAIDLDPLVQVEREFFVSDARHTHPIWVNIPNRVYWVNGDGMYCLSIGDSDFCKWGDGDGDSDSGGRDEGDPAAGDLGVEVRRLYDVARDKVPLRSGWVLHSGGLFRSEEPGDGTRLEGNEAGRGETFLVPKLCGPRPVSVPEKTQKPNFEQGVDNASDDILNANLIEVPRD